jgi:hypothetical protein
MGFPRLDFQADEALLFLISHPFYARRGGWWAKDTIIYTL